AHRASIDGAALLFFEFVDQLHSADFGRARERTGRQTSGKGIDRIEPVADFAFDIGDQMHHVTVALDEEAIGDFYFSGLGHSTDIIAAEIDEHEMFGPLLRIAHKLFSKRAIGFGSTASGARARNRPDGDDSVAQSHKNFRARSDDRKAWKSEMIEKWRWVQ